MPLPTSQTAVPAAGRSASAPSSTHWKPREFWDDLEANYINAAWHRSLTPAETCLPCVLAGLRWPVVSTRPRLYPAIDDVSAAVDCGIPDCCRCRTGIQGTPEERLRSDATGSARKR